MIHIYVAGRRAAEDVIASGTSVSVGERRVNAALSVPTELPFLGKKITQEYVIRLEFGVFGATVGRDYKLYVE